MNEFLRPDWFGGVDNYKQSVPAANVKETETEYVLELAIPGRKKEDFNVEIDNDILTISSEVKNEENKEDEIFADEDAIDIAKYLDLLPEEQREVIVFRHYYDYSFKQIAEITNTNLNTALGRMRYALINLRKLIAKNEKKKSA